MMGRTHKTAFSFLKVLIKLVPYVPMKELCIFLLPQLITHIEIQFHPHVEVKRKIKC